MREAETVGILSLITVKIEILKTSLTDLIVAIRREEGSDQIEKQLSLGE